MKAHVLQSRSFFLKSLDLDFGQILLDEESTQIIVLTNIGNKKRSFTIASDKSSFSYCHPKLTFQLVRKRKKKNFFNSSFLKLRKIMIINLRQIKKWLVVWVV